MTYCADRDQEQRLEQYAAIKEIYLSGIGDAADGLLPAMAEIIYIQGYVQGMRDYPRRVYEAGRFSPVMLPVINQEIKEFPLVCHQC